MKLQIIGPNQTVLRLESGVQVFFSYETPVAAYTPDHGYIRSGTKYSVTTSRHVNNWAGKDASVVDQSLIDNLL